MGKGLEFLRRLFGTGGRGDSEREGPDAGPLEVNLGLDFGTSATKAVAYSEAHRLREVVLWPGLRDQGRPFSLPSCVALEAGRLYFGSEAEARDGVTSFKVCVACESKSVPPCPGCREGPQPGSVSISDSPPQRMAAEDLATLYLAFAVGQSRAWLESHPQFGRVGTLTVNMAAPLDHLEHKGLRERFRVILHRALLVASVVRNGMPLEEAEVALRRARSERPSPLPDEAAHGFLVPEASAAMTTAMKDPATRGRMCAVIDIGAGSTDVGVFWAWRDESEDPVQSYYSCGSRFVGGDTMDRELMANLVREGVARGTRGEWRRLRSGKPSDGRELFQWNGSSFQPGKYAGWITQAVEEVYKHYQRTWGIAKRDKARQQSQWGNLHIILSGGGSRCWPLEGLFRDRPPMAGHCDRRSVVRVKLPPDLRIAGQTVGDLEDCAEYLAVAVGLSYPILDIPRFEPPEDVPPLPKPAPPPPKPPWELEENEY